MRLVDKIIFGVVGIIVTALIIYLVVIPSPKEFISYLALSFIIIWDTVGFFIIFPIFKKVRKRPKTVSKRLIVWLSIVLYACFLGVGFLINAYFLSETAQSKIIESVFGFIFGAIGTVALFALVWITVEYFLILNCLKHGDEYVAEFVSEGKSDVYEYGDPKSRNYSSIRLYSVGFKFSVCGKETVKNSKRVFTAEEVDCLRNKRTFKIKYKGHIAVIDEIPEESTMECD